MKCSRLLLLTSVAAVSLGPVNTAMAGPQGGHVTGGSASISPNGNKTDIHQNSDRAILDWRSFDVGAQEHVEFHQPSSNSIALNRINDTKASQIDGKLTANGHVMLINPNGVVFGKGAQVDVGSLTASSADINNDDFMAGKMDFDEAGKVDAAIINHGSISVKEVGLVNFVAPRVENHGVIAAKLGKVQLAAADTFTLDMAGDGLLQIAVSDEEANKMASNTGRITAEGGLVALTATSARNIVDSLVENSGIIEASSMSKVGGKVILSGSHTRVAGSIKADGRIGGGEILIGGDYRGRSIENVTTAKVTKITTTAKITASATDKGDGGKVIIWADKATRFEGEIEAKGGEHGGDGGFVETSGKIDLDIAQGASVNAAAHHEDGAPGSWLLDPSNVTITDGGTNNIAGGGGTFDPTVDTYSIDAGSISAALNNGNNVTITTTANGGADAEEGDITISNATIEKNVNNNDVALTFQAHRNIMVSNSSITSFENALNLILNADRDANQDGAVSITNSTIKTNGGHFVAGGDSGTLWGADGIKDTADDAASTGADNVAAYGNATLERGIELDTTYINTGAGDVFISGVGYSHATNSDLQGFYMSGGKIETTTGSVNISGIAGNGDGNSLSGATFSWSNGIETNGGDITIYGEQGNGDGDFSRGVGIIGTTLLAKNEGAIIITGEADDFSGTDASSIRVQSSNIETRGNGALFLDGTVTNMSSSPMSSIGGDFTTGLITLKADRLNLIGLDEIKTSGTIHILPKTASTAIDLGTAWTPHLSLEDNELALLNAGNKLIIGDSTNGTGDVIITSWDLSSKDYDVEVYGNDFNVGGIIMGAGNILLHAMDNGGESGDLIITNDITRGVNGVATLNLRADRNISNTSNAGIEASDANNDANTDADSLNVILNADRDADQNGSINLTAVDITTLGGDIIMGGGTNPETTYAYGTEEYNFGILVENGSDLNAGGGNITLNGHGKKFGGNYNFGVNINLNTNASSLLTTGNGLITLNGQGGGEGSGQGHFGVRTIGATITAENGDITINGSGGNGTSDNIGFDTNNTDITHTGNGNLIVTAISGTNTQQDIDDSNGNNSQWGSATTNNITINANSIDFTRFDSFQAANNITITPRTSETSIGLAGAVGDLQLDDATLAKFNAGNTLIIGNSALNNNDVIIDTWDLSGETFDLSILGDDFDIGGLTIGAGDITFIAQQNIVVNTAIGNSGAGGDVALVAGNYFINRAGANAIDAGAGRYLIYTDGPSVTVKGGLGGSNLYNRTYSASLPESIKQSGDKFIYAYRPTLTFTARPIALDDFQPDFNSFIYTVEGFEAGDTLASAFNGLPAFNKTRIGSGRYQINIAAGSLLSQVGYNFEFVDGRLSMPGATQRLNSSVEFITQAPDQWFGNSRQTGLPNPAAMQLSRQSIKSTQHSHSMQENNADNESPLPKILKIMTQTSSNQGDADVRLIEANLLKIEKPVVDFYDLCSYNVIYCQ